LFAACFLFDRSDVNHEIGVVNRGIGIERIHLKIFMMKTFEIVFISIPIVAI